MSATVGDGSQERNGQVKKGPDHVAIRVGDSPGPSTLVKTGRDEEIKQKQEDDAGPVANGKHGTEPSISESKSTSISGCGEESDSELESDSEFEKLLPITSLDFGRYEKEASDPAFVQELEGRAAVEFFRDMPFCQEETRKLRKSEKIKLREELYKAAQAGDWDSASSKFESYPLECEAEITNRGETVLHIAVTAGRHDFVRRLLGLISDKALTHPNIAGNTPFLRAASSGHVGIATLMLKRNKYLALFRGVDGRLPIHVAADAGKKEMVWFLYEVTRDDLTEADLTNLFLALIDGGIYDFALKMLKDYPDLAEAEDKNGKTGLDALLWQFCNDQTLLSTMAGLPKDWPLKGLRRALQTSPGTVYAQRLLAGIWESQTTYFYCLKNDEEQRSPNVIQRSIILAAEKGKFELLSMLKKHFPNLIFMSDEKGRNILHVAVYYRHVDVFKFIYKMDSDEKQITTSVDLEENNLLHFAAMKPPEHCLDVVAGAALQLQRELLWFEAVKKVVPKLASKENAVGKTPENVLMDDHRELMKAGEKWMKNTANSCMLVATLIATVVFAAAFTLPGGNNQETGIPIFLGKTSFKIFAVFDAVALMLSVSSILIFLSIFSSTYSLDDFRWSLPNKLILGLGMLLFSIVAMLVAFVAAFYIIFEHGPQTYATLVAAISPFPVLLFVRLHYKLFLLVVKATYAPTTLFKANNNPTSAETEFHADMKID